MGDCSRAAGVEFLKSKLFMIEHFFQCPYCWETISMLLDPSVTASYVEDCEVCCNPIEVSSTFEENELVGFIVQSIEQ